MEWLDRVFGRKALTPDPAETQAILIRLDGVTLPQEVYDHHDLDTLEEALTSALGDLGEFDGHETGPTDTTIYLYGPDAEAMFRAIEPTLVKSPLARGADVTLRAGPPGSSSRQIQLPA